MFLISIAGLTAENKVTSRISAFMVCPVYYMYKRIFVECFFVVVIIIINTHNQLS